ncbi:antitoxin [Streptomyces vilmorinianum]|uniref:antitoxin n=1 Tax=Streptomyces vilmorinianum TaxID=3051092 RepID=UPI0010FB0BC6|nr:antitoxin [Streptomyces vilmorinianum]
MGIMDKLKGMVRGHEDQARQASDAAERTINEKTGNKYTGQVDQAQQKIEGTLGMPDRPEQPPS